jgi:hypothetical protein
MALYRFVLRDVLDSWPSDCWTLVGVACEVDCGVLANDFTGSVVVDPTMPLCRFVLQNALGRVTVGALCELDFGVFANDFTHPEELCCCRLHDSVMSLCFALSPGLLAG